MALVISLIFLAVVSLLAMASMQSALLQEKMAGNQKESQQALQAAEMALRAAERYLEAGSSGPYDNSAGLYEFVSVAVDPASPSTAWRTYANSGLSGRAPNILSSGCPIPRAATRVWRLTSPSASAASIASRQGIRTLGREPGAVAIDLQPLGEQPMRASGYGLSALLLCSQAQAALDIAQVPSIWVPGPNPTSCSASMTQVRCISS